MRIKRAVIIPAILALGAAGSILAASAAPVAASQASSIHVVSTGISASPDTMYDG
jgi:hypothetical protein